MTTRNTKGTGPMCEVCKASGIKRRASYGYDDKKYLWCASCAKTEFVLQEIEDSRRVDGR